MKQNTEKNIVMVAMGITGYHVLAHNFTGLPMLPQALSNSIMANISLITLAAAGTIYGIYMLITKY